MCSRITPPRFLLIIRLTRLRWIRWFYSAECNTRSIYDVLPFNRQLTSCNLQYTYTWNTVIHWPKFAIARQRSASFVRRGGGPVYRVLALRYDALQGSRAACPLRSLLSLMMSPDARTSDDDEESRRSTATRPVTNTTARPVRRRDVLVPSSWYLQSNDMVTTTIRFRFDCRSSAVRLRLDRRSIPIRLLGGENQKIRTRAHFRVSAHFSHTCTIFDRDVTTVDLPVCGLLHRSLNKQAVGGRPPRYAPAQACNGSPQRQPWARPAEPGPISQYESSSRPAAHAARLPDVRDRRQTDVRHQTDRRQTALLLNAPCAGHNK